MLLQPFPSSARLQDYQMSHHLTFHFPVSQKALSRAIDQSNFDHLLEDNPVLRSRALLLSTSIPHAGDWLRVLPSSNLGLHFLDCEFRLCLQYWLEVPLAGDFSSCPICSRPVDPSGDHALACGGNNDRVLRHNSLRDVIFSAVQSAALSPRREVPSLVPDSLSRPADVYLPHWFHGRPAAVDVTVISPLQYHTLLVGFITGLCPLCSREEETCSPLRGMSESGGLLSPLAVETLGGWSKDALVFLRAISRHHASQFGLPPGEVSHHLLQRLSVTLRRFNAQMWLGRFPTLPSLVDGLV